MNQDDLKLTLLNRYHQMESLMEKLNDELKLCKSDIQRLENSGEIGTSRADGSTTFRTAQSHLVPDTEQAVALPPPPALPFLQLPLRGARPQPRRSRSKPDWTKWPRIMGCKYSVSNIRRNLTGSASECGTDKLLTTRLFFAIASPLAMAQLQELLGSMRQNNSILPIPEIHSFDGALNALCISQGSSLITSIRTRLHLVDLVELYKRKRMEYQRDNNQAFTDPETIAHITSERFPLLERDAPEFKRQYDNLRRKLYDGRNWHMLALEFGKSIVYFLPSRGEFEISNTIVQRVPECHFDNFLAVLREKRGSFLRKCIEQMDGILKDLSNLRRTSLLRLEVTSLDKVRETKFDSDTLLSLLCPL
ncbi:hypothetical protein BJX70DRAFT_48751 [Aspergillus crustosus]